MLIEAVRDGASRPTLVRIAANIALDACIGAIPVLGDVYDVAWKANLRNLALLERHQAVPGRAQRADRTFVVLLFAAVAVLFAGLLAAAGFLTTWLLRTVGLL
jgi:hypothetical protein